MHLHRIRRFLGFSLAVGVVITCAACGGGPGAGDAATQTPVSSNSAGVPGYGIMVQATSPVVAGTPCTLHLQITPDAGSEVPAAISAWAGNEYGSPGTLVSATPAAGSAAGNYQLVINVPTTLNATTMVWIRLTMADGSVREASRVLMTP